jgi:hypothetical protein
MIDEVSEMIGDVGCGQRSGCADLLGGNGAEAPCEHRQIVEQQLQLPWKQLVRPLQGAQHAVGSIVVG